jgi:hypothetical protein
MAKDPALNNPTSIKKVDWILRIAVFGTYLGHGVLALQLKPSFLELIINCNNYNLKYKH